MMMVYNEIIYYEDAMIVFIASFICMTELLLWYVVMFYDAVVINIG